MNTLATTYFHSSVKQRIALSSSAVIVLSGVYCLAYRYSIGNPAGLMEAFSWGAINLAPWMAAIEIGRSIKHVLQLAFVLIAAAAVSLLLGTFYYFELPDSFELVRRLPGAALTILALIMLKLIVPASVEAEDHSPGVDETCLWAHSAGNYVELHFSNGRAKLVRATLGDLVGRADSGLVRIHRSYAIASSEISEIERAHVKMQDGTRLPIGNRYRDQLSNSE